MRNNNSQFVKVKQLNTSYNLAVQETVNQFTFFLCSKTERGKKENVKYRRKNFNGGRRNHAFTDMLNRTNQYRT